MKVGIVTDNYKLSKYKEDLTKAGFIFSESPFTKDTTTIAVLTTEDKVEELSDLCRKLEFHFKNRN